MKYKVKKTFLSILACSVILNSFSNLKITNKGFVSFVYQIDKESLVNSGNNFIDFNNSLLYKEEYSSFATALIDDSIPLSFNSGMVPQGITIMDDYILTSSYDYFGDNNSEINVLDKNGKIINTCLIDCDAHVGGISYDVSNKLVWITGKSGEVNAYSSDDFLVKKELSPRYKSINVGKSLANYKCPWKNSVSYLTVYDNCLYVGSFSLNNFGIVKKYSINISPYDKKLTLSLEKQFKVPTRVQGISFYTKDNENYILLSRSYGRNIPSLLQIFKYSDDIEDYNNPDLRSVSFMAPEMMEQITICDEEAYTIFESGALPYKEKNETVDNICVLDANLLIKKLKRN